MPLEMRDKVPTSNFFQRSGYERNPIARRTGTVAALVRAIETKMDNASQAQGAKELAERFRNRSGVKTRDRAPPFLFRDTRPSVAPSG